MYVDIELLEQLKKSHSNIGFINKINLWNYQRPLLAEEEDGAQKLHLGIFLHEQARHLLS